MKNLAERIRHFRMLKKLTQENMAEELKMSHAGYQMYESGRSNVSVKQLYRIAEILGVSVVELLGEEAPEKPPGECENCKCLQRVIDNQSDYIQMLKTELDDCRAKLGIDKKKAS